MGDNRTVKVTLKAEVASYVAQMLRGQQATESLGGAAAKAGSDVETALAQAEKSAQSSSQAFDKLGTVTKRTFAGVALVMGGYGAALLHQGVQANSFAERNRIALTTMLGDATDAQAALDAVYGLATETPFQFPMLTDQFKNFVAAQLPIERIIPLMRSYSSAVAALGGSGDKLAIVSDALQDMITRGKAQGDQLNRLTEQGIPAWHMLAEAMGTTVGEVEKQASAGAISALQAVDILTESMQDEFGGMLENMGDSYSRWEDKLSSAQRRTAEQLAVPVQEVGKEVMRSLTALFNDTTAVLGAADWDPIVEPLMAVPDTIDRIAQRVSSGGAQDIIEGVGEGLELVAAAGELVINVALPLLDVIALAARAGMPLVDVMTLLLEGFNALPAPVQAGIAALALIRTLNGPYTALIASVTGTATATRAAIAEQVRYQRVWRDQLVMEGIATSSSARLNAVWAAGTTTLAQLGSRARAAGSAVMGAFGGPVGLAVAGGLAAVTIATTAWTDAQRKAEEAARAQEAAIDAVSGALDRNTGAFTENAKAVVADQLIDAGLPNFLKETGISLAEFETALYGGADAQEDFRNKLIKAAQTPDMLAFLERTKIGAGDAAAGVQEVAEKMTALDGSFMGVKSAGLESLAPDAYAAIGALQVFDSQVNTNTGSVERLQQQAALAGREVNINGEVSVDTSQAMSALQALQESASKALASFLTLSPQKKKSGRGGGGGGGGSGESPAIKALKAEQKEIKKRTDAEKKAAAEYERIMRKRAQEAEKSAREAEKAASDAASAEEAALDKSARAVDNYVSAQRQRAAIERTLAAETDPVRRAQLQQALTDALAHEAAMLAAKTAAERDAATATTTNREAQERATSSLADASKAQADLEAASERSALVQERAAAQVEAAAERLAAATESSASRSSGAMSGAADDVKESLREWIDRLKAQVAAQVEWADNMVWLAGNASGAVVGKFAEMGSEGAYLLAELRRNGGNELAELETLFGDTAAQSKLDLIQSATTLEQIYPALVQRFGRKAADELRSSIFAGTTDVNKTLSVLKASYDGKNWRIGIDANTTSAVQRAGGLVSYIQSLKPRMQVILEGSAMKVGNKYIYPGMSEGGPVIGPGQKGKDSLVRVLAPGEHVLTAGDVDAMGGQSAVSAFRRSLHDSPPDISRAVASGGGGGGGPRTVIHQTVYYPVAEPSSKAAIRADRNEVG